MIDGIAASSSTAVPSGRFSHAGRHLGQEQRDAEAHRHADHQRDREVTQRAVDRRQRAELVGDRIPASVEKNPKPNLSIAGMRRIAEREQDRRAGAPARARRRTSWCARTASPATARPRCAADGRRRVALDARVGRRRSWRCRARSAARMSAPMYPLADNRPGREVASVPRPAARGCADGRRLRRRRSVPDGLAASVLDLRLPGRSRSG